MFDKVSQAAEKLATNVSRRAVLGSRSTFKPCVECLEDRTVPATLKFMTWNVNEGTDFVNSLAAIAQHTNIAVGVSEDFAQVVASDIPDRAFETARLILRSQADVVGLQEASVWSVNGVVKYDILNSIVTDLNANGEHYQLVAVAPDGPLKFPTRRET